MKSLFGYIFLITLVNCQFLQAQNIPVQEPTATRTNRVIVDIAKMSSSGYYIGYEKRFLKGHLGFIGECGLLRSNPRNQFHLLYGHTSKVGLGLSFQTRFYPGKILIKSEQFTLQPFAFAGINWRSFNGVKIGNDPVIGQTFTKKMLWQILETETGLGVEMVFLKRLSIDLYTGPRIFLKSNLDYYYPYFDYIWYPYYPTVVWTGGCMLGFKF